MARAWYQVSLTTYLPLWIASHEGARTGLAQVLFVLVGSLPAGSLLGGTLSDRVGRWQVVLAAAALLVPANGALLAVGPGGAPAVVLPLTAAVGCLIGMTYPVAIIMAQEAWPRNIGLAGGLVMGLGWLPGGVGASAIGLAGGQCRPATSAVHPGGAAAGRGSGNRRLRRHPHPHTALPRHPMGAVTGSTLPAAGVPYTNSVDERATRSVKPVIVSTWIAQRDCNYPLAAWFNVPG